MSQAPESPSPLLSTTEAARALGLSQSTLSRYASDRRITPTTRTPGGHMRWDLDQLREQLEGLGAITRRAD